MLVIVFFFSNTSLKVGRALTHLAAEFGLPLGVRDAAAACSRLEDTFSMRLQEDETVTQQNFQRRAALVERGRGPRPGERWGFEGPSPTDIGSESKNQGRNAPNREKGPSNASLDKGGTDGVDGSDSDTEEPARVAATAYVGVPLSKHRRDLEGLWKLLSELRGGGARGESAVQGCLAQVR